MPPKTRKSSRIASKDAQIQSLVGCQKNARSTANKKKSVSLAQSVKEKGEHVAEDSSVSDVVDIPAESIESADDAVDSDSESVSSSSAEDSEDDYEKEVFKKGSLRKIDRESSSEDDEDHDESIVRGIEKKIDREIKQKRLKRKEKRLMNGDVSNDDEIICDFESSDVPTLRKRRLYRRRMIRATGTAKRRRIKRPDLDVADDFTCDTLVHCASTTKTLTRDINWEDPDIDEKAGRRIFRESDDEDLSANSEEDEADIISHNLSVYQARNSKERVAQSIELEVAPFSEKLACYNSIKSVHGGAPSLIQNHHPNFLVKQDIKLPEELLWERPFTSLLYMRNQFDPHEKVNDFLNSLGAERDKEKESKMVEELTQYVSWKEKAKGTNNLIPIIDIGNDAIVTLEDDNEELDNEHELLGDDLESLDDDHETRSEQPKSTHQSDNFDDDDLFLEDDEDNYILDDDF